MTELSHPSLKRKMGAFYLIVPLILFVSIVEIYPIINVFIFSMSDKKGVFVGLKNFIHVLEEPIFPVIVKQSLKFTLVTILGHLILGTLFALLLNQPANPVFRIICRSVIMLSWAIAPVVVGVMWNLLYNPYLSIIPHVLSKLGLGHVRWALLANPNTALNAVIVANIWSSMPFYMLMLLAALQTIPPELYEAAWVDGAGALQRFFHITLPYLRNTLILLAIFDFVGTFILFDLIWSMTKGGPVNSTEVFATYTYRLGFENFTFNYSAAAAIFMFLFMLTFTVIMVQFIRRDDK